jgi:membrane protein CcdC involved in cytochrome C biogenesis
MILAGIISAAALLFLLFKLGISKVVSYDIPIDIAATGFLMAMFAGTYGGMMAAMLGGLIISVVLYVLKKTVNRQELHLAKSKRFPYVQAVWVETPRGS